MADQLPAEPTGLLDDLRMMIADLAVQRGAGADAIAGQNLHDPPDADPVAVIPNRPVADVRDLGVFARHPLVEVAGHHVVEPKELDVRIDPKRHPGIAGPGQLRAAGDRQIGKRAIASRRHVTRAANRPPSSAALPPPTGSAIPRWPWRAGRRRQRVAARPA